MQDVRRIQQEVKTQFLVSFFLFRHQIFQSISRMLSSEFSVADQCLMRELVWWMVSIIYQWQITFPAVSTLDITTSSTYVVVAIVSGWLSAIYFVLLSGICTNPSIPFIRLHRWINKIRQWFFLLLSTVCPFRSSLFSRKLLSFFWIAKCYPIVNRHELSNYGKRSTDLTVLNFK